MDPIDHPNAAATKFIRIPVAGPKPCNTLAFVRCRASGVDVTIDESVNTTVHFRVRFKSKFLIDGFQQAQHAWYEQNTQISATGFIQLLNQTDDNAFLYAIESVDPFIDLDGVIGFEIGIALFQAGPGFAGGKVFSTFDCTISAYVLLYEPLAVMPPVGKFEKSLAARGFPQPLVEQHSAAQSCLGRAVGASELEQVRAVLKSTDDVYRISFADNTKPS